MNIMQIEYFLALCKHMNFTQTARSLYVSQPAISKQITALERELDLTLFIRSGKNLQLSAAGKILYTFLDKVETDYQAILKEAKRVSQEHKIKLVVGVLTGWDPGILLPESLGFFHAPSSGFELTVEQYPYSELISGLMNNTLDIMISYPYELRSAPDLASQRVMDISPRLFYSNRHHLAHKYEICLEDFQNEMFAVTSSEELYMSLYYLNKYGEQNGFSPRTQTMPNTASIITAVQLGLCVALFDQMHKLGCNPSFKYLDLPFFCGIYAIWKKNNSNPLITVFLNQFVADSKEADTH